MDNIQVAKRSGGTEAWNYDKLVSSIAKAGLDIKAAESVANEVELWARENSEGGRISSDKIRDRVIAVLEKEDSVVADNFKAYKKT